MVHRGRRQVAEGLEDDERMLADGVPCGLEKINTRNSEATFSVLRVGSDPTLGENAEIFLKAVMRLWHKQVTCPPGRAEERTVGNMGKEGPAEPGKGKEKNSDL